MKENFNLITGIFKKNQLAQAGDPPKPAPTPGTSSPEQPSGGISLGLYALVFLGAVVAFGAYRYLQATGQAEGK